MSTEGIVGVKLKSLKNQESLQESKKTNQKDNQETKYIFINFITKNLSDNLFFYYDYDTNDYVKKVF